MLALPIFPGRLQPSIVSANELNCRVRNGNGWTLIAISTNYTFSEKESKQRKQAFSLLTALFAVKYTIYLLQNQALFVVTRRRVELLIAA